MNSLPRIVAWSVGHSKLIVIGYRMQTVARVIMMYMTVHSLIVAGSKEVNNIITSSLRNALGTRYRASNTCTIPPVTTPYPQVCLAIGIGRQKATSAPKPPALQ